MKIDFSALAADLLQRAHSLLPQWFPAGKFLGREFEVGNLQGEAGTSLKINAETGRWSDFAAGNKGGDLISLYAAMHGLSQIDAAKALGGDNFRAADPAPKPVQREKQTVGPPPAGTPPPNMRHSKWGEPSSTWTYRTADGGVIGHIARYDPPGQRKQIVPWSWDTERKTWRALAFGEPRPLYGLDELNRLPHASVLIVEGEKAADAARRIVGDRYAVVTWPGGAKAINKIDWAALHTRKLLLWPDADEPGIEAMRTIAARLSRQCPEAKLIDVQGQPDGWDAADAMAEGWDWGKLLAWAKPRVRPYRAEQVGSPNDDSGNARMFNWMRLWEELGLDRTGEGKAPLSNLNNAVIVLQKHKKLADLVWYDEFAERVFTTWGGTTRREWTDADDIKLCLFMQRHVGISRMTVGTAHEATTVVAKHRTRNELTEWLDSLEWDGEVRLPLLMPTGFGAEDAEYSRCVGVCWMIGMVARAYRPGEKVDHMPVFEGGQGIGKSTALAKIGGPWFTECHESVLTKDFYGVLQGKLLVEIAEMHSFTKSEVDRIKGVITCQVDRYRAPYGRNTEDHPRRSVFAGTTNRYDWNRDETGARRFWPIRCGVINLDWIVVNRDQLFAEAVDRYRHGELWWDVPIVEARAEQEARRQDDTWEETIEEFFKGLMLTETTTAYVLENALRMKPADQDRASQLRVASAMRLLGWESIVKRYGEKIRRVWVKKDE